MLIITPHTQTNDVSHLVHPLRHCATPGGEREHDDVRVRINVSINVRILACAPRSITRHVTPTPMLIGGCCGNALWVARVTPGSSPFAELFLNRTPKIE